MSHLREFSGVEAIREDNDDHDGNEEDDDDEEGDDEEDDDDGAMEAAASLAEGVAQGRNSVHYHPETDVNGDDISLGTRTGTNIGADRKKQIKNMKKKNNKYSRHSGMMGSADAEAAAVGDGKGQHSGASSHEQIGSAFGTDVGGLLSIVMPEQHKLRMRKHRNEKEGAGDKGWSVSSPNAKSGQSSKFSKTSNSTDFAFDYDDDDDDDDDDESSDDLEDSYDDDDDDDEDDDDADNDDE
jgi:hypothetical protein